MKKKLDIWLELGKARISSLATISMITGYVLARGAFAPGLVVMIVGVFLIASGAATINHIQERDIDGLMQRTKGRPLPSGRLTIRNAWRIAVSSLLVGSACIMFASNATAMLLGWLAVFWYNAVYTPLKRVTAFAAVLGGVVGAIPPIIGWVAGGGAPTDPPILAVSMFFFIWQVPHFWLLLLFSCGTDYERAGLPSLTQFFSLEQIARITFVWIFAAAVMCLGIPLFGVVNSVWVVAGLVVGGGWLVLRSRRILRLHEGKPPFRLAFGHVNAYLFWVAVLLSVNGVMS